jgi:branched-chain amino acid transport system ATP-binding protein
MPAAAATQAEVAALELRGVTAGYGRSTVLRDVTVTVPTGGITALLGPNGAGKTTLLRVAAGLLRQAGGAVRVSGNDMDGRAAHARTRAGICLIPEGRGVFPNLSVRENLRLQIPTWQADRSIDRAIDAFPVLGERLRQPAGRMSGGQQQMLAVSRCFLARPTVVLLDEVSMGLAPRIVDQIFDAIRGLAGDGVALLLVEQYVTRALAAADYVYLLNRGEIAFAGEPSELDDADVFASYVGADIGH